MLLELLISFQHSTFLSSPNLLLVAPVNDLPTETAKHFGGGLKGGALRERIRRDVTPFVQPMVDAVKARDCIDQR